MTFSECVTGSWYVVITCGSCGVRQPLYPDASDGKAEVESTIARCAMCKRNRFYEVTNLERYQHSPSGGLSKRASQRP